MASDDENNENLFAECPDTSCFQDPEQVYVWPDDTFTEYPEKFCLRDTVKVLVGPDKVEFIVDKELICSRSPFFDTCINNKNFKEGNDNVVYLPEDDPDAFDFLVEWIMWADFDDKYYEGRVPFWRIDNSDIARPGIESDRDEINAVRTWMLAKKLMIEGFDDSFSFELKYLNVRSNRRDEARFLRKLPWREITAHVPIMDCYMHRYKEQLARQFEETGHCLTEDDEEFLQGSSSFMFSLISWLVTALKHEEDLTLWPP